MQERRMSLPEIFLISATRGMLGFGAGLLLSEYLRRNRRKAVGWALLTTGVLSTIPLAIRVFRRSGDRIQRFDEHRRRSESASMQH